VGLLKKFFNKVIGNGLKNHGILAQKQNNKHRSLEETIRFESAVTQESINRVQSFSRPYDANYRGFSQFNEDGILQYLIRKVGCPNRTFVEIGTEDYTESNTRFLLEKDWWTGLTVDSSSSAWDWMTRTGIAFLHDVRHICSFVTKENIDQLIAELGQEVDLVSIDIDGMDYYLFEAMTYRPRILMIEFNPLFGKDHRVVVPYSASFSRKEHHHTMTCYGASLSAMVELANRKNYVLVETSDGPNAFFVAREHLGELKEITIHEAWRNWNIKESFNTDGSNDLVYDRRERIRRMSDGVIIDLSSGKETTVGALYLS
jgi:hypothetical protein